MNMDIYEFEFDIDDEGSRLDAALSNKSEEFSRSRIQKLIKDGCVHVNGMPFTDKSGKVRSGDSCIVYVTPPVELAVEAEDIPLEIVYEDDDVMVINKPPGMVVHPAPGNYTGTVVNAVMYHCGNSLSSINGVIRPGIVHRIDKDTSGLLMIAKNDAAHKSLTDQLKVHSIKREYRAIVYNSFKEDEGSVDRPVGRDPKNRLRMAVEPVHGKHAVTHYRVVERLGDFCHLSLRLETGRTHQIRVHMAHLKHPLVGDEVYGPSKGMKGVPRQMLHAKSIGFIHPGTGDYMEFESELPDDFVKVLNKLGASVAE